MKIIVTLKAVLKPGADATTIAERLENYAADAVKYIDGVDDVSITSEVDPPVRAEGGQPGIPIP